FSCCQDVLRRLDKTFQAFFARLRRREKPGFPRFRSFRRYDSITFPSYGDGCRLLEDDLRPLKRGLAHLGRAQRRHSRRKRGSRRRRKAAALVGVPREAVAFQATE
ncbi:MAG: hypothetical protein HRJ53_11215, partial [Acidobacteria bacterium Pan2503]|nr:hypothetical protein [Candidatus Acidoferrum panamensis]